MNTKTLTSHNGPLLQITLTPWEVLIFKSMVKVASITSVTFDINDTKCDPGYARYDTVGVVLRDFYKALDKLKEK